MIFACGKTATLHRTTLVAICNYIPLNNWKGRPLAVSSSSWMFNITSLYVSYILYAASLAIISRSLLKWDSAVNRCQASMYMNFCQSSDVSAPSCCTSCLQHVSWHHGLQGWSTYLWKENGEVEEAFSLLCTHRLPLEFMTRAETGLVLQVHYHSSIASCFHDACLPCKIYHVCWGHLYVPALFPSDTETIIGAFKARIVFMLTD